MKRWKYPIRLSEDPTASLRAENLRGELDGTLRDAFETGEISKDELAEVLANLANVLAFWMRMHQGMSE